jgi:hypothetical protein
MTESQKINRLLFGPSIFEKIVVHSCGAVFGVLIGLSICHFVEKSFFPVVTDFKLSIFDQTDGGVIVAGGLYKQRACTLVATNVYGHQPGQQKKLLHTIKSDHEIAQISTGAQSWGPVKIELAIPANIESISIESVHKCHPFWSQETIYGRFDMRSKK